MGSALSEHTVNGLFCEKYGNSITIINYRTFTSSASFICNICNNEWVATPQHVYMGYGCKKCREEEIGRPFVFTLDYVRDFIESKNCKLISNSYINEKEKIKILFDCGHEHEMSFGAFRSGERCPCGSWDRFKSTIANKTKLKIIKALEEVNFEFLSYNDDIDSNFSWNSIITYKCDKSHIVSAPVRSFMRRKYCKECRKILTKEITSGPNANNWKGGITELSGHIQKRLYDWKKDAIESCSGKCVITGEKYDHIHHVYSFDLILKDAIEELNFELKNTIGEYTKEELNNIVKKVQLLHKNHPGVCLCRKIHTMFHKIYGKGQNTPEQFEEFKQKITSGEIKID